MPRLPPSLLRFAASRNIYLARLLRECRDLESASNELRWLAEHAYSDSDDNPSTKSRISADARLKKYVLRRSKGEPLQYILGSQPFGQLEIQCRPNVLIPRPETELYTTTLARLLKSMQKDGIIDLQQPMRIADLCTGTGCIALLLHALLRKPSPQRQPQEQLHELQIVGIDISDDALRLAPKNLLHNLRTSALDVSSSKDISFQYLDVLKLGVEAASTMNEVVNASNKTATQASCFLSSSWDVIISNPPYISPVDYALGGTVGRSVRDFEPKLALVPPTCQEQSGQGDAEQADRFYEALLHIAGRVETKVLVMEIGDSNQAERVRRMATRILSNDIFIETWRDDGCVDQLTPDEQVKAPADVRSQAHERAVVVWIGSLAMWRLHNTSKL